MSKSQTQASLKVEDGSRIAVIGGGPAGSFFSYFLLNMAERAGITIHVDIYEPRDYSAAGPPGCNMCAGVVSESLVQMLAAEGINLPPTVVQRGIDSYVLHMDVGSTVIESVRHEKRIAATYRGIGPRGIRDIKWHGLDSHLLEHAINRGAHHILSRVERVEWTEPDTSIRRLRISAADHSSETYDLMAVTVGVNTTLLKQFTDLKIGYTPPRTTRCVIREYFLGEEAVARYLGDSMHAFLLNIPRLEFAALIPKGAFATLVMLGEDIDTDMLQSFLDTPEVSKCFPPGFPLEQSTCQCRPRINFEGSKHPYGDRIVFVGDSGVTRLYKDGIGSAYRTAKAAASTAIFQGISAEDFRRHYWPACHAIERDNAIGKIVFTVVREIQKKRFSRNAVLNMVAEEQRRGSRTDRDMTMVLWDMFTGSAPYTGIFMRTLHPAFWLRFLRHLIVSQGASSEKEADGSPPMLKRREEEIDIDKFVLHSGENGTMAAGALGKVYGPGEIIIRQGEVGDAMHVIQEGQVEILVEVDGREVQLAVRGEGEILGEMAIFEREARMATVRALDFARVLTVDKENLMRRIHEDPSLAFHTIQAMSRRIRDLSKEVVRLREKENARE